MLEIHRCIVLGDRENSSAISSMWNLLSNSPKYRSSKAFRCLMLYALSCLCVSERAIAQSVAVRSELPFISDSSRLGYLARAGLHEFR